MTITAAAFKIRYPEFASAPDDLVVAVIAEKELITSDSWGDRRDSILMLSVADELTRSPKGRNGRIDVQSNNVALDNPYAKELEAHRRAHSWLRNRT